MSAQTSERPASVVAFAPKKERGDATMVADDTGRGIVALLQKAADMAKQDCDRAMDVAHSYELPRKEHASLRPRQIIFGNVPLGRKIGLYTFTMKSSRHSFRKRNATPARGGRGTDTP
jgi:hypothetical protein